MLAGMTDRAVSRQVWRALAYPGRAVDRPCLLTSTGLLGLPHDHDWDGDDLDTWLADAGGARLAHRTAVVSIGSNSDADTLARKLGTRGVSQVVPLFPALVSGIGTAHSAHVSLGGYVAAAPHVRPHAVSVAVLGFYDAAQLNALDHSEPNYRRVSLSAQDYPLSVLGWPAPTRFAVYRSVWGVLGHLGRVVSLRAQPDLHGLVAHDTTLARRLPLDDPVLAVQSLLEVSAQSWVREHWRRSGNALPDGFEVAAGGAQLQPLVDPQPSHT